MRTKTLEISVGMFVLAGLLAIVVLALKVSGLSLVAPEKTYTVTALFDNAGALRERARVAMAGVVIGRVTHVELDSKTYMARVVMEIERSMDTIPVDSTASIVTAGLLGEKYVAVSVGGDPQFIEDGGRFEDTQSALVLEELVGKFLLDSVNTRSSQ